MAKQLSEQQQAFIDALMENGGIVTDAAKTAGYSKARGYALVRELKEDIIEAAEYILAMHAPRAANTLTQGLGGGEHTPTPTAVDCAKQVLDRVGLVKKDKVEISGPAQAIFFLPPKDNA
jgi:hypothetical protein